MKLNTGTTLKERADAEKAAKNAKPRKVKWDSLTRDQQIEALAKRTSLELRDNYEYGPKEGKPINWATKKPAPMPALGSMPTDEELASRKRNVAMARLICRGEAVRESSILNEMAQMAFEAAVHGATVQPHISRDQAASYLRGLGAEVPAKVEKNG